MDAKKVKSKSGKVFKIKAKAPEVKPKKKIKINKAVSVGKDGSNAGNIPNKKLKCWMGKAKNGATYRACATPEKNKQPKKMVRGKPRVGGKGGEKAYPDGKPKAPKKAKKGEEGYVKKKATEAQLKALAKGRATRKANAEKKKKSANSEQKKIIFKKKAT
jgi:hypothetical protein